jgi:hypothetical protein
MSASADRQPPMRFVEKLASELERAARTQARPPRHERLIGALARHRRISVTITLLFVASAIAAVISVQATASAPPPPQRQLAQAMPAWVRQASVPIVTSQLGHVPAKIEWMRTSAQTAMRLLGGRHALTAGPASQATYVVLVTDKDLGLGNGTLLGPATGGTAMFFILAADTRSLEGYGFISGQAYRAAFGPMSLEPASPK